MTRTVVIRVSEDEAVDSRASVILTIGPFPDSWIYLRLGNRYWQLGCWYIEWGPFPDKFEARTRCGWYSG